MNTKIKRGIIVFLCAAVFSLSAAVLLSFSRAGKGVQTVFADSSPAVQIPSDSLAVAEALQGTFRAVSDNVLPAVVELDVVEKKTVESNPFSDLPFFFFGLPKQKDESPREYSQQGLGSGVIVRRSGNLF